MITTIPSLLLPNISYLIGFLQTGQRGGGVPNNIILKYSLHSMFLSCIVQSEELLGLRSSHDRRVERMQTLDLNYKLLLEQLKTYETER